MKELKRTETPLSKGTIIATLVVLLMALFAASCDNVNDEKRVSKGNDDPCIITPKLKEALKNYEVNGVGDGFIIVGQNNEDGRMRVGCMDFSGKIILPVRYSSLFPVGDDLLIAEDFDKSKNFNKGCINLKGKKIIPFQYDVIRPINGYFIVQKNGKYGILDRQGKEMIPIKYDNIEDFYQVPDAFDNKYGAVFCLKKNGESQIVNLSKVQGQIDGGQEEASYDYHRIERNGKYGYLSKTGKEIPCQYQDAREYFSEGLVAVVQNNKVGFIDKNGDVAIPFQFEYTKYHFNYYHYFFGVFSDGYACVMKNKKFGYIDKQGKTVIPYEYLEGGEFHHGVALVSTSFNKCGLIDKNNSIVLPFEFEGGIYSGHMYETGDFYSGDVYKMCKNGKWGVYSLKGECIVPCKYDQIDGFHDDVAVVLKDGRCGLIDVNGRERIPCQYDFFILNSVAFGEFVEVAQNGKHGIVDMNNQVVVPLEFDGAVHVSYNKNLFFVKKNGRFGLYDRCGNCTLD